MRNQYQSSFARALAALALVGQSLALAPAPTALAQTPDEEAIVSETGQPGRHFRQTGGGTGLGYDVREPFFSAMNALGGATATGFPVSAPFQGTDGCLYQTFQVVLLQQCAGGPVVRANTFQILEENGADERLNQLGIGPGQSDPGTTFEQAKANRLAWLEDAAIRDRYLSQCGNGNADAAVEFCGLPMNQPRSFGPFISQRFQRIAFQRWTTEGPGGITAGQVTASLGGDLLKDTGVLTGVPVQPHLAGQPPAVQQISFNRVGSGAPATGQTGTTFRDRATLGIVANPVEAAAATAPERFASGREGQELAVGDVVRAPGSGTGLITYLQGATTEVSPGATVVVREIAQAPGGGILLTIQQTAGQAIHRISNLVSGSRFQVVTPNATAVVRGTIFRITVLPGNLTLVEVFDGSVGVGNVGVSAGQYSIIDASGNVTQSGQAPAPGQPPAPPANPPATGGATAQTTVTATPTVTPTPQAQQRTTPLGIGFQGDFYRTSLRPDSINKIKESGAGWAKQQVLWDQLEIDQTACQSIRPFNATSNSAGCMELIPGRYFRGDQITFLEAVVKDLAGGGLRVMLSVVRAPSFVAASGGHAPGDPERLGQFLTAILSRPEIKGRVQAVEPWNEQNLSWEWGADRLWPNRPAAPPQGAVDFVNLQKAAYRAIKAVDGGITVVLPALTPTGLAECWESEEARTQGFCLDAMRVAIDDRLYLDFMYRVNNGEIRNFYDVLGVHPSGYNNPPTDWVDRQTVPQGTGFKGHGSFYIRRYEQLRAVQLKYGDSKPMWFTEVGWTVTRNTIPGYEYGRDNTEDARGKYFGQMLDMLNREAPYVTQIFVWNLNFRQVVGENDEKYGFGVLNSDGAATPAFTCIQDFARDSRLDSAACR